MKCVTSLVLKKTSRERPKSAPYLRLKNSKRTSMCQVFSSTVPAWRKNWKKSHFFEKFFSNFFVSDKSHSAEKCWRDLKKALLTSISSASRSSVAFSVSSSQRIKLIKSVTSLVLKTSRERPKTAPYLRLKNSKRNSKFKVFSSTVPAWGKKLKKILEFFLNFFTK